MLKASDIERAAEANAVRYHPLGGGPAFRDAFARGAQWAEVELTKKERECSEAAAKHQRLRHGLEIQAEIDAGLEAEGS